MFAYETHVLSCLTILVVCHDLTVGQILSHYTVLQRPTSWFKAREFCQRHYVDLAVLSTEEQYFTLLNATAANTVSFWLGLQRQSTFGDWRWVNGDELSYSHWFRRNYEGRCASLEAMLQTDRKLLARFCDESHMFVCQGPVSPQSVTVDLVGTDCVILSWNVSTFMQTTPHSYNVTTCTDTCNTLFYPYTDSSAFMNISISHVTAATKYIIEISAVIVRPDCVTGGNVTLQSSPTTVQVRADSGGQFKAISAFFKWLKLIFLAPPLCILYHILKKCNSPVLYESREPDDDASLVELSSDHVIVDLIL